MNIKLADLCKNSSRRKNRVHLQSPTQRRSKTINVILRVLFSVPPTPGIPAPSSRGPPSVRGPPASKGQCQSRGPLSRTTLTLPGEASHDLRTESLEKKTDAKFRQNSAWNFNRAPISTKCLRFLVVQAKFLHFCSMESEDNQSCSRTTGISHPSVKSCVQALQHFTFWAHGVGCYLFWFGAICLPSLSHVCENDLCETSLLCKG